MSGPVLVWEQLGLGFVRPLDEFAARASGTFDLGDFFGRLIAGSRWSGRFGDPLGHGPLLAIPVNWESYNLAYLPDILARAGVDVPRTWAEYFAAAMAIPERVPGARGFGQRGAEAWHTVYTGFATQLWSCGGRDFDPGGSCAIASEAAVEAARTLSDAIRVAGPADWTSQGWYELAMDFAHGKYGLLVDSDHYVAYFENPGLSEVAGQVRYALPPAGPGGIRRPNMWMWSIVMNARTAVPDAAWELIEWATSPQFLTRAALQGNMNPTRRSTWADPEFAARAAQGPGAQPRYAYEQAGPVVLDAVRAMQRACAAHGVPLAAAALQFSAGDPRVTSTVVGVSAPSRIAETARLLTQPVPDELWAELASQGRPA